jgi:hypothetical protein
VAEKCHIITCCLQLPHIEPAAFWMRHARKNGSRDLIGIFTGELVAYSWTGLPIDAVINCFYGTRWQYQFESKLTPACRSPSCTIFYSVA